MMADYAGRRQIIYAARLAPTIELIAVLALIEGTNVAPAKAHAFEGYAPKLEPLRPLRPLEPKSPKSVKLTILVDWR